ncbi:MAG: PA0069 family radical SAM protein [Rhodospirillales bacterium]|nr:PA0069 family radical SAM protein [Rhodospirillales bacterium]
MVDLIPPVAKKGRGAVSNRSGRFEAQSRHAIDDGWQWGVPNDPTPLRTTVTPEYPKTVIAKNSSPDIPFDRSLNPYKGCEHGCVYCYARPSHAYLGFSPGLDFESQLVSKPAAAAILEGQLRQPGYQCQLIQLGANTDPYQPIERKQLITRQVLQVFERFNHPFGIITKSDLVLRDLDILAPMAAKNMASVAVSITTLDRDLARRLEPRAPTPMKRLEAVRKLSEAGIPTTVMIAPVIPALTDHELERIIEAAALAGASSAVYILLRLPLEIEGLFEEWLETHAPLKRDHVLSLLRQSHGGRTYRATWQQRMTGSGPYAEMIGRRYRLAIKKFGLQDKRAAERQLDCSLFQPPPQTGDQLSLL